jgi:hypothetical protein
MDRVGALLWAWAMPKDSKKIVPKTVTQHRGLVNFIKPLLSILASVSLTNRFPAGKIKKKEITEFAVLQYSIVAIRPLFNPGTPSFHDSRMLLLDRPTDSLVK